MRLIGPLAVAAVISLTPLTLPGQTPRLGPVKLRYNFAKGQTFVVTLTERNDDTEEDVLQSTSSANRKDKKIGMTWEVLDAPPEGDATIAVRYDYAGLAVTISGVTITIDTRRPVGETNGALLQVPQVRPVLERLETTRAMIARVFIGTPFKIAVSPQGRVRRVEGFDVIWDKYREEIGKTNQDLSKRAELDALIEGFFGEGASYKLLSITLFVPYPVEPAVKGHRWADSYVFEIGQFKLPVKRTFQLDSDGAAGAPLKISYEQRFETPEKTAEVEFEVTKNLISAEALLDAKSGTLRTIRYGGKLQFEIYALPPNAQRTLAFRSISDVTGSVEIAPR